MVSLLERARRNNARVGVTGLLLYREGNFMQALEGREEDVTGVHGRIAGDPWHRGLITPLKRPQAKRLYGMDNGVSK